MVIVYSRGGCAPCRTLKYWLDKKQVDYKEFPIEVSEFSTAPTIIIGDEIIHGLNFPLTVRTLEAQSKIPNLPPVV